MVLLKTISTFFIMMYKNYWILHVKGIWIQYFLKEWSSTGNAEFSKKYGFQERERY